MEDTHPVKTSIVKEAYFKSSLVISLAPAPIGSVVEPGDSWRRSHLRIGPVRWEIAHPQSLQ